MSETKLDMKWVCHHVNSGLNVKYTPHDRLRCHNLKKQNHFETKSIFHLKIKQRISVNTLLHKT